MEEATVFALSSGAPPAAIGVVRISGTRARAALLALHGRLPLPRRAALRWLHHPVTGEQLDRALLLWLPGPRTATGEDLAELHLHGGRAVTAAVLAALDTVSGLRRAEAGEFTRRALANGIIDLAEAEGLADLLSAETEAQRRNAQQLAGGVLSRRVGEWQRRILHAAAAIEAMLDFGDEDDVADDLGPVQREARAVAAEMTALLASPPAERLRDGVRVVIAGPPNAGKSSLLNAIAGREAAITSPTAGTTRDLIEVPLAIAGRPFVFVDTAGLHEAVGEEIEREGIVRARAAAEHADVLLWLGAPAEAPAHPRRLILHARNDVPGRELLAAGADVGCSAVTGDGLDRLAAALVRRVEGLLPAADEMALNQRQRSAVAECVEALGMAREDDAVIVGEALRLARLALDRLTGRAGTEEMLDALFGRFCIGK